MEKIVIGERTVEKDAVFVHAFGLDFLISDSSAAHQRVAALLFGADSLPVFKWATDKRLREARKRPGLSSLERTAFHEAGHAVAAVLHHRALRKVTIVPDKEGGTLGLCSHRGFGSSFKPDVHAGRKERDLIERDVTVRLAGPMVEALVSGRWNHVGASSDYEFSWNLLEYPCGDLCEVNRYFNRLLVRTEVMFVNVDPNWRAVEQFAEVLLRKKTIGSRRAREIVLEALRSSTAALTGTGQERR